MQRPGRLARPRNSTTSSCSTPRHFAAALHARVVSCVEVMRAYLDHIAAFNSHVNAIVALQDRDSLLSQARTRDEQLARGDCMGPLHGFPHAVKDLQAVKGILTTQGSPILKDFIPTADSVMVERLRKSGAIFIGKPTPRNSDWDLIPTIRCMASRVTPMILQDRPAARAAVPQYRWRCACCR